MMLKVLLNIIHPDAKIPKFGSQFAACADLYSVEEKEIFPGKTESVSTGLKLGGIVDGLNRFVYDYKLMVWARSGLAWKNGLQVHIGTIDSDYRGEIKVLLFNHGTESVTIHSGDRIAQMSLEKVIRPSYIITDVTDETERGEGGFGHTGKR